MGPLANGLGATCDLRGPCPLSSFAEVQTDLCEDVKWSLLGDMYVQRKRK